MLRFRYPAEHALGSTFQSSLQLKTFHSQLASPDSFSAGQRETCLLCRYRRGHHRPQLRDLLGRCHLQPRCHMSTSAAHLQVQLKTTGINFCASRQDCLTPNHPMTHSSTINNDLQQVPGGMSTSYQRRRPGDLCCCILLHSMGRPLIFSRGRKRQV